MIGDELGVPVALVFGDVGACDKGLAARAAQHHGPDAGVAGDVVQMALQLLDHGSREGVEFFRAVESEADGTVDERLAYYK
ncbi:hypothetical protein D3C71_1928970 [compost metagenome]